MKTRCFAQLSLKKFRMLFIIVTGIAIFPLTGLAQSQFEGVMNTKIDVNGHASISADMYIKGGRSRIEMDMPGMPGQGKTVIIYDQATKKIDILMPAMKKYMERTTDETTQQQANQELQGSTMKETDSTKTIAGQKCRKYIVTMKDGKMIDIWATKNLGSFSVPQTFSFMNRSNSMPDWAKKMQKDGLVGLSTVVHNSDGSVQMTMVVTNISKKSLSDNLFQIPNGYTELNMPAGMQ